jgi:hypothetical protein
LPQDFGKIGKAANFWPDCHCPLLGGLQVFDSFAHRDSMDDLKRHSASDLAPDPA